MASTFTSMAMRGVRSSWATSEVRRCSIVRSRSRLVAMSWKVSPNRPISSSPSTRQRAVRSPLRRALAACAMRRMGLERECEMNTPMMQASNMAAQAAAAMAP